MANEIILSNTDIQLLAAETASSISRMWSTRSDDSPARLFPIPRGGVPAAFAILAALDLEANITNNPEDADFFIDDILDSGKTLELWSDTYPGIPFITLVDKQADPFYAGKWVIFPWERKSGEETGLEDNIVRIMEFIGEDPTREGLQETPKRVIKAMRHWFSGYGKDPASVMKVFSDGAEGCDEMVVVEKIPFFSHCEHHMAPIIGTATVAYIPDGKIIGLSKIPRLLEIYARRMQVQERLTSQVAAALMQELAPLGCGVFIKARHLCMESRGIEKIGTETITCALRGVFKDNLSTRNEFMAIARK